ncbi:hypothetical protein [Pseudalkalibacillus hwajinpoensis]|uniref:hypothetical protein n=1 Tax=Guptibacillus hwajinpoensis TaxID=208199 RepID=UPI001CD5FF35|nr:hypothetical protein [Pseudalkalibacillus hwajinpoensis]MCA0991889.1 hypothetical protein [Pseudalkalibacillus hwajinpoensis]
MDFLKTVVIIAFLLMTANIVKPFVTSSRKRAAVFAGFWLLLYIVVWGIPAFVDSSSGESSSADNKTTEQEKQDEDEAPEAVKEEEAQIEEEIDFDPASVEFIVDAKSLLGLSREEFVSQFPKNIEVDEKDPLKMTFENGEVLFKDNIATSMTYFPEGLQYLEDNRLLLASLGFEVDELRKGSNPFETPVTLYLVEGFSDVTIYGREDGGEEALIEKIYLRKEFYSTQGDTDAEAEE